MRSFGYKSLAAAVVSVLAASGAHAAGLDRSGQDVTAFLQDGTYAEFVYTYIDADVSGYDNGVASGASTAEAYTKGKATGDMAEAYDFFRFGVKGDINDRFSVGVLYDEPFGAAVQHMGESNFNANKNSTATALTQAISDTAKTQLPNFVYKQVKIALDKVDSPKKAKAAATKFEAFGPTAKPIVNSLNAAANIAENTQEGEGTNVEIRTHNATLLLGAKFGENRNFQIYGGPAVQQLKGQVHLRGAAYQSATGYDAKISTDNSVGWVAGIAYSKPEIALKAALTYRSEIEHETDIAEVFPALALAGKPSVTTRDFKVTLPESYNLDFQTGLNPKTLLTAKVRYVPWSDFAIEPPTYGDATAVKNNGQPLPIVSYSKDQWSAELGLGRKLNDKLAVSGSIGYDSGAGNPATTLGPIKGYYSVGLGAKYNFTPEWSVSVGGKYLKFGDATAQLPTHQVAGKFADNDGFIAGVKLAYHAK